MKKTVSPVLTGFVFMLAFFSATGQTTVTRSQVSGIWNEVNNDSGTITRQFVIKPVGNGKVFIKFTANNAERKFSNTVSGMAVIKGNTIILKPTGSGGDPNKPCTITLKFIDGDLVVIEKGDCGWGRGISSEGQYQKMIKENAR